MTYHRDTYTSLDDLAEKVECKFHLVEGDRKDWTGLNSHEEALVLAREGWQDEAAQTLEIAGEAVDTVTKEYDLDGFKSVYDVAGSEVDVSRFLDGEPECMINYLLTPTPGTGRVITLCAGVIYSCSQSTKTIMARGRTISALAMAITGLGFNVELWADMTAESWDGETGSTRVLVKGANDELDPAKVMYAYSHPSMARVLGFASQEYYPSDVRESLGYGRGVPAECKRDLPEGTTYIDSYASGWDQPDIAETVKRELKAMGIIEE